jgi:tetratricopeptide (TPR) repeat protein
VLVTSLSRPQPLGVLALPAGWLVLPAQALDGEAGRDVRDSLMAGRLPTSWPAALHPIELAAGGQIAAAAAAIDPTAGPEHAYNHFVLTGEPASLELARSGVSGGEGAGGDPAQGDLAALVAVAAYSLGHGPASDLPDPAGVGGEVAAHVLAAHAAARLEARDPQGALDALVAAEQAAAGTSPVLAAVLLGQQAGLLQEVNGADPDVITGYRDAVDAMRGLDAVEPAMAELALGLATAYQELAAGQPGGGGPMLLEAIRTYHLALRVLRKEEQPQRYAFAHSNLALCYLSMPVADARDKLRRGVAVQSLREAQSIYTREAFPREWAAVTLNLANALQHLPTVHPVENLVEAVGMYEELLAVRPVEEDPLGHARVLANQGTALAHLGIHDQAVPKLQAARALFAKAGDAGAVATVDGALADVDAVLVSTTGSTPGPAAYPAPTVDTSGVTRPVFLPEGVHSGGEVGG